MNDAVTQTTTPEIVTPPATNTPEARTPDGTIKDQSTTTFTDPKNDTATTTATTTAPTVPDAYTFKIPEGATLDNKLVESATPIFKELGLNQDQAQKLVDLVANRDKEIQAQTAAKITEMRESWRKEVLADKDMGGKLDDVKATIGRAKNQLPSDVRDAFNRAMDETGIGDHPAFVKAFWKLSELVSEGKPVSGNGPSTHGQSTNGKATRPTLASAMYPNLSS
jgi:hypothetical protein